MLKTLAEKDRTSESSPYPGFQSCLAVVILTLNEEANLPICLAAVPPGLKRLILDSGSTDNTRTIAATLGVEVYQNPWPGFAAQRNFALEHCNITANWVLFIDADEIYEAPFWQWAECTLPTDPPFDAVFIDSRLVLDGVRLEHAPGYPLYHARLVRRQPDVFVVGNAGHNETVRDGLRIEWLDIPYIHDWHAGSLLPWMRKHLQLAEMEITADHEANGLITARARLNRSLAPGPLRVIARFAYHYVVRSGFRDGRAGFKFACMYAWYEMTKWLLRMTR